MLTDFLADHPSIYALGLLLYAVFERWLGNRAKGGDHRAGSLLGLLEILAKRAVKRRPKTTDKESDTMPIREVKKQESKELAELFDAIEAVLTRVKNGEKFSALTAELEKIQVGMQGADLIDDEYRENPAAFLETAGARAMRLVSVLIKAGGVTPGL